jgi:hypothetical protein
LSAADTIPDRENLLRIIAAPREENDILAEERARLSAWAPANDWLYLEFTDAVDLLSRLSDELQTSQQLTEIEIVAHGNPTICNDVSIGNVAVVAESLRRLPGVTKSTAVYLSGCNTGLQFSDECIAASFAMALEGSVLGTRGYVTGTHAERNERCVASFTLEGIVYDPYPGGEDAVAERVWKHFGPSGTPTGGESMQVKIATSGFRSVNLTGNEAKELLSSIEQIVRTKPTPSARMRMAPDLTFAIRLSDGEHVFELLAGGTVLRDPVTKQVWQFEQGRAILQSLLPYRKLPAA